MHRLPYNTIAFDTLADLASYMRPEYALQPSDSDSWFGGVTGAQAIAMLRTGDTSSVAQAERLIAKFDIHLPTQGHALDLSPAGFMPCVPAFVGGEPECMYDMVMSESDSSPLKIIVDPTASSGVSADTMKKRGTVILAAVMALAAQRPVQLEVACILDACAARRFNLPPSADGERRRANVAIVRVGINSAPLDLASAGYALSHSGFTRHLLYGIGQREFNSELHWPSVEGVDMRNTRASATQAVTLELLQADPDSTLFIPSTYLQDPILTEPEKWVGRVLAKYGQQELTS